MDVLNDSEIETKIQLDPAFRKQLVQYGMVAGILFLLFIILLCSTIISRSSWKKGLKAQLVSVYEQQAEYEVKDFEPISTPFSV